MTSCPSDDQLLSLLDEQLDQANEARIVAHVEDCSSCQERLEQLVHGHEPNAPWSPASAVGGDRNGRDVWPVEEGPNPEWVSEQPKVGWVERSEAHRTRPIPGGPRRLDPPYTCQTRPV